MKKIISGVFLLLLLTQNDLLHAGRLENVTLWTNSTVPIKIDLQFTVGERNIIIDALNEMMDQTNIVFKFYTEGSSEKYLLYTKILPREESGLEGGICPSFGMPVLSFSAINFWTVKKGTVIHETMHALGFAHEQCRSDRNNHVTIIDSNILLHWGNSTFGANFSISSDGRDIDDYSFNSIMHYRYNAGGKTDSRTGRKLPTIRNNSNSSDTSFGHRSSLSESDIQAVNNAYPFRPQTRTQLPKFMEIGSRKTVTVQANKFYNFFGIPVEAGQVYRIDAWNSDKWKGSWNQTSLTAEGVSRRVDCKRFPNNKFMRMLGTVYLREEENESNDTGKRFAINSANNNITVFRPTTSGYLMFFANDCPMWYSDNSGSIRVHIYRDQ